jgi:hypothetical protein
MHRRTQPQSISAPTAARSSTEHDAILGELAQRFAAFRRTSQRFTRVPRDLRAAATAAMRRGVTPSQLRRACGLSSSQLERWRESPNAVASSRVGEEGARIFSVVDDVPSRAGDATHGNVGDPLELRIGPWSVTVRVAEPQARGRG